VLVVPGAGSVIQVEPRQHVAKLARTYLLTMSPPFQLLPAPSHKEEVKKRGRQIFPARVSKRKTAAFPAGSP